MPARYVLTEPVGSGGMGSVWRAWDRDERRWVAAKVLDRADGDRLARFGRERALRVRHRHVVSPVDPDPEPWGARAMYTMDLVRGGTVADLLRRYGALPEGYVRLLLEQLLEALVAVHAAGVVHRDVKPANLLLEPTGTGRPWLRLADFGIAVATGAHEDQDYWPTGETGTGPYRAPEAAAGSPPSPQHDLYAAGVVGLRLLAGPGTGSPAVPTGPLGLLLSRLADPDPQRRPPDAASALADLRAVPGDPAGQSEADVPDVPDLLGHRPPPGCRRRLPAYAAPVACFGAAASLGALVTSLLTAAVR